jgi:ABC-2 type transport system permease protein
MRKYFDFFKNSFKEQLAYRSDILMILVSRTFSLTIFVYLWLSIYSQGETIGDYALPELISYYIFVSLLDVTVLSIDVGWWAGDDIRLGEFTNYLLQPISYFWSKFSGALAKTIFNTLIFSTAFLLVAVFAKKYITLPSDPERIFAFLLFSALAFILYFLFSYLIGITAFWIADIKGLNFSMRTVSMMLSGGLAPLTIFPPLFQKIANCLPFKYFSWYPVALAVGKADFSTAELAKAAAWITLLGICAYVFYSMGVKKYEGYGA